MPQTVLGMAPDRIIQILRDEYLNKHGEPVFQIILDYFRRN